jgi:hypothetical protein
LLVAPCACTQDFGVFEPDASTQDGALDVTQPGDSGRDSSADAGNDAPVTPDAGSLAFGCGNGTVTSCDQCNGMPEPCVYCAQGNATMLAGECVAAGTSCMGAIPNGFVFCQCGVTPNTCPETYQVCRNGGCRTCSESATNAFHACKGGGQCNPADGGCS